MTLTPRARAYIQIAATGVSVFMLAFIFAWLEFGPLWDMLGPR